MELVHKMAIFKQKRVILFLLFHLTTVIQPINLWTAQYLTKEGKSLKHYNNDQLKQSIFKSQSIGAVRQPRKVSKKANQTHFLFITLSKLSMKSNKKTTPLKDQDLLRMECILKSFYPGIDNRTQSFKEKKIKGA